MTGKVSNSFLREDLEADIHAPAAKWCFVRNADLGGVKLLRSIANVRFR